MARTKSCTRPNSGQPALFVVGMAAARVLAEEQPECDRFGQRGRWPELGRIHRGLFCRRTGFSDALRLVQRRGQAMQAAADAVDSGMASVVGMDLDVVTSSVRSNGSRRRSPAAGKSVCPGNIAVSGHISAIDRLEPAAIEAVRMKVIRLAVAGAFHTPLMDPAVERATGRRSTKCRLPDTRIPVYSNVDADAASISRRNS